MSQDFARPAGSDLAAADGWGDFFWGFGSVSV